MITTPTGRTVASYLVLVAGVGLVITTLAVAPRRAAMHELGGIAITEIAGYVSAAARWIEKDQAFSR